jgi:WD40 repeat protein
MSAFNCSHALVIGIDDYHNDISPLRSAVNDATVVANVLETQHGYRVTCLLNQAATLARLKTELEIELPQNVQPDDRLLIYFAGHGIARNAEDGPAGYLIPQDAKLSDPATYLSMHTVYRALRQLQCRHLLVILDCCFAGTFRWAATRKALAVLDRVHREHFDRFTRFPAWEVLTSAAHNQEALDMISNPRGEVAQGSHSPFAQALIKALRDNAADYTQDGVITVRELYIYIEDEVAKLSKEQQTPGHFPLRQDDFKYERGKYVFTRPGFDPAQLTHAPNLEASNNPYRGLKPFDERHSDFFFGREALVKELTQRLTQTDHPLIGVLGVSGSGKSSLVKAGLIPHLRKLKATQTDPEFGRWCILDPIRPAQDPFGALARAMLPIANPRLLKQLDAVPFEAVFQAERSPTDAVSQLTFTKLARRWRNASPEAKLLLLIDYFPQLQHLCSSAAEQSQYAQVTHTIQQTLAPLTQLLQQEETTLSQRIGDWSREHPGMKLLLVIDQFEELITMGSDLGDDESQLPSNTQAVTHHNGSETDGSEHRKRVSRAVNLFNPFAAMEQSAEVAAAPNDCQRFLQSLSQVLIDHPQALRLVVTLRSDFEPRFQNSVLHAYWQRSRFPLRPMTSDELRQAIEGPAIKQALYFETPDLVGKLVDEVGQTPGALPLLSFTLSELYIKLHQRWRENPDATERALLSSDYEAMGGMAGALSRRAKEEYDSPQLDEVDRQVLRNSMLRMVSIEGGSVTRRRVPETELVYAAEEANKRVMRIVDRLVNARLLVKGQENEICYVEPAHDFLVRGWDELQQWIKQQQELITLQRLLTPAAEEWRLRQKPRNYLWYANPRLALLEQVLRSKANNWLNQLESEFVQHSVNRRKQIVLTRWSLTGLAFVVLLSTLMVIWYQLQRTWMQAYAARAENLLQVDPVAGMMLSIRTTGQNHANPFFGMLSPVQASLLNAMQVARESNHLQQTYTQGSADAVAMHPNGQIIASAGNTGQVYLWDREGELQNTWQGNGTPITSLEFSPDGSLLIGSGRVDGQRPVVQVWGQSGQPIQLVQAAASLTAVAFSPDGGRFLTGYADGRIQLRDRQGNWFNIAIPVQDSPITTLALSQDGQIASGDDFGRIRLWDSQGQPVGTPLQSQSAAEQSPAIRSLSFSSDGQHLLSNSVSGAVFLWSRRPDAVAWEGLPLGVSQVTTIFSPVSNAVFSPDRSTPDRSTIVSGGEDGTVRLWTLDGQPIGEPMLANNDQIRSVAVSPDQQTIVSGSADGSIRLWSLRDDNIIRVLALQDALPQRLKSTIGATALSRDGNRVAIGDADGMVYLWDTQGNPIGRPFRAGEGEISTLHFSETGEELIAGDSSSVRLWDWQGKPVSQPIRHAETLISEAALSPDGQRIISGDFNGNLAVWDRQGNRLEDSSNPSLAERPQDAVSSIAFNSQGKLAIGGTVLGSPTGSLCLLNLASNSQPALSLQTCHREASSVVAFSPKGETVAIGGTNGSIRLLNTRTQEWSPPFRGHQQPVTAIAFSPIGDGLASGSRDGTIRFSNLQGEPIGQPLPSPPDVTGAVTSIAFSEDGKTLIVGNADRKVWLWQSNWRSWLQTACNRLRYHPVMRNPQTEINLGASQTCRSEVFSLPDRPPESTP